MADVPVGVTGDNPKLWDVVYLDNTACPGFVSVEVDRKAKKDKKSAKGQNGSEQEYSGADDAKVKIRITIWTKAQLDEFLENILPIVEPNPDKSKIKPVQIFHPVTYLRKVTTVNVDSLSGPSRNGQVWTIEIDATEHRPPTEKNAKGTYKGGAFAGSGNCLELRKGYDEQKKREKIAREQAEFHRATFNSSGDRRDFEAAQTREAEARAYANNAAVYYSTMVGLNCPNKPPSGGPATQP